MKKQSAIILHQSILIRRGIKSMLEEEGVFRVVGEASEIQELAGLLGSFYPDLLLADTGILNREEFRKLKDLPCPALESAKLVGLASSNDNGFDKHFEDIININAKTEVIHESLQSLHDEPLSKALGNSDSLSEREINVLREIVLGHTNKEVGDTLFISPHTVITHRKNITRKIGIRTVSGLTVYAIMNGIVGMDDIQSTENK